MKTKFFKTTLFDLPYNEYFEPASKECKKLHTKLTCKINKSSNYIYNMLEEKKDLKSYRNKNKECDYIYNKNLSYVYFDMEYTAQDLYNKAVFLHVHPKTINSGVYVTKKNTIPTNDEKRKNNSISTQLDKLRPRIKPKDRFYPLYYPGKCIKVKNGIATIPTGGRGSNKKYQNIKLRVPNWPKNVVECFVCKKDDKYTLNVISEVYVNMKEYDYENRTVIDIGNRHIISAYNPNTEEFIQTNGISRDIEYFNRQLGNIKRLIREAYTKERKERLEKTYQRIHTKYINKVENKINKIVKSFVDECNASIIVVGDLSVDKHYNDNWMAYALKQLKSKALENGIHVVVVDEENTSKTCHVCGKENSINHNRMMECECGNTIDKDLNACKNIDGKFSALQAPDKICFSTAKRKAWLRSVDCEGGFIGETNKTINKSGGNVAMCEEIKILMEQKKSGVAKEVKINNGRPERIPGLEYDRKLSEVEKQIKQLIKTKSKISEEIFNAAILGYETTIIKIDEDYIKHLIKIRMLNSQGVHKESYYEKLKSTINDLEVGVVDTYIPYKYILE